MFEDLTYENILKNMLNRVPADIDKREGSVIYDAIAPCAYHLAQMYFNLNNYIDLFYMDTAVGEYLDRKAADYGLTRKAAVFAKRKINTTGEVQIGTRWGIKDTTYIITEKLSANVYSADCEQSGEIGNTYSGTLENIDNVSGVTASLTDIIKSGEDEETDDNLRNRFFAKVQTASTSGNAADYKKWALEVSGVGDAKIFPLWNGPGTVKVVIVDNDKKPASAALINETAEFIEKVRPIGPTVSVVSGVAKAINISATLTLASGYSLQTVTNSFSNAAVEYFKSIAFSMSYVSYAKIGTILLGTDGIIDYSNLRLNDKVINIPLANEEIPSLGTVVLGV